MWRFWALLRTGLAVGAATTAAAGVATAQSAVQQEFAQAKAAGTTKALIDFMERYPLSPEADEAFRALVTLSAGGGGAALGSAIGPVLERGELGTPEAEDRFAIDIY